jgi:hypothetical protein
MCYSELTLKANQREMEGFLDCQIELFYVNV